MKENFNIYCHDEVAPIIRYMITSILRSVQYKYLDKQIFINVVSDNDKVEILNYTIEFFDIYACSDKQFGFKTILNNVKTLAFLGDEPYNELLKDKVINSDWLLHETFCLHSHADIFKPYEKNHATVRLACETASKLNIKNLILWHSEEKTLEKRKELYFKEGNEYFKGNLYIPYDLEEIEL